MIKLEITGETVEHFYAEAVRSLAMFLQRPPALPPTAPEVAEQLNGPSNEAPTPAYEAQTDEEIRNSELHAAVIEPEPKRKRTKSPLRLKIADQPVEYSKEDTTTLEDSIEPPPPNAPTDPTALLLDDVTPPSPRWQDAAAATEKVYTREDCRDAVRAILAAHTKRGHDMPACVEYVKKLFVPFGIKQAAEIPEDRMAEFVAAAQHYIAGTVQARG